MNYLSIIKIALIVFPFIAFLVTLPYILKEYHKYGSVYWYRALIIYSFILYLLAAYFLVILPLPSRSEVIAMTSPTTQLIPFNFVTEFIKNSGLVLNNFNTYITALKSTQFIVPIFNIILTIPFAAYLHYYFKCNFKKTIALAFLLSLFFELTQLTGLYFIYPRGYRLFDIDDLILNTFGGLIGYFLGNILLKFLPNRENIDKTALELGKKVSIIRRSLAYCLDLFLTNIIFGIIYIIFELKFGMNYLFFLISYFIFLPYFFNGQTIGCKFLKIKIVSTKYNKLHLSQMIV